MKTIRTITLLAALAIGASAATAASPTLSVTPAASTPATHSPTATVQPPAVACPTLAQLAEVTVTDAGAADFKADATPSERKTVWLRGGIQVTGTNLQRLVAATAPACHTPPRKVILYLDGRPLPNLTPYPPSAPDSNTLKFELKRDESSRAVWTHILGGPLSNEREVKVSVGLADGYAVPSTASVHFRIMEALWFGIWLLVLLVIGFIFFRMAARSDMLRDYGSEPGQGRRKAFSLARTQAAFWFLLTLVSYAFIGLVTGDFGSTITKTVLALMGIGAGTALGSSLLDVDRTQPAGAAPGAAPAAARPSHGFLQDVLSGGDGVNFHRFQMFAWTLVLGIVFVHDVWTDLAMPEFDATLLGLLGISAGTYLGLKTTSERS